MYTFFCKSNWKSGVISNNGEIILLVSDGTLIGHPNEGIVFCGYKKNLFAITEEKTRYDYKNLSYKNNCMPRFFENLAPVLDVEKQRYGYINRSGKWVISPSFEHAGEFKDGLAIVFRCNSRRIYEIRGGIKTLTSEITSNPQYHVIDRTGQLLFPLRVDEIPFYGPDNSGWPDNPFEFVAVVKQNKTNHITHCVLRGFNDCVLFPEAKELRPVYRGVVACKIVSFSGPTWQIRSSCGNRIIAEGFMEVGFWAAGLCPVQSNKKWGAIDIEGKWIIPPKYDHLRMFQYGLAVAKMSNEWIVINRMGENVLQCHADYVEVYPTGILIVMRNKVIIYDFQGNILQEHFIK